MSFLLILFRKASIFLTKDSDKLKSLNKIIQCIERYF